MSGDALQISIIMCSNCHLTHVINVCYPDDGVIRMSITSTKSGCELVFFFRDGDEKFWPQANFISCLTLALLFISLNSI